MRILSLALLLVFTAQPVWAQFPFAAENSNDSPGNTCAEPGGCCPSEAWMFHRACIADNAWVSAEYLLWSISPANTPPLLTTSPQSSLGVLGAPGTTTLFGGTVPFPQFSGVRISGGYWFNCEQTCGIEGSFFSLFQNSRQYSTNSNGSPVLARPFIDALTGLPDSQLIANLADPKNQRVIPLTGRATITMPSQLWGADLNGVSNVCAGCFCNGSYRLDWLGGFRFLSLKEGLNIEEDLQVSGNSPLIPGTTLRVIDNFSTQNYFYGGQIGARLRYDYGAWELGALGKLALGVTQQQVTIRGSTYINDPSHPPPQTFNGGLLALSSNIGSYSRDVFSVVPEVDLTLGYHLTDNLKVFVGYTFLYWSSVARPGDQIDLRINPNLLPPGSASGGPRLPSFSFHGSDLWSQGISLGLELRF